MKELSAMNLYRTIYHQREIACTTKSQAQETKAREIIQEAKQELNRRGRNYETTMAYRQEKVQVQNASRFGIGTWGVKANNQQLGKGRERSQQNANDGIMRRFKNQPKKILRRRIEYANKISIM